MGVESGRDGEMARICMLGRSVRSASSGSAPVGLHAKRSSRFARAKCKFDSSPHRVLPHFLLISFPGWHARHWPHSPTHGTAPLGR